MSEVGAKSTAGLLRAAFAVTDALARLPPNRALTLAELAARTGISVDRLRRLIPAMLAAGWRIASEPDPRGSGPCRAKVYSLAATPRDFRQGSLDRTDAAP